MNHIQGLRSILGRIFADALLLTSPTSQRYAVDFPFSDGFVLITETDAYLITDFRYKEEAEATVDPGITVVTPVAMQEFIFDTLRSANIDVLGIEDHAMTLYEYDRLFSACGVKPFISATKSKNCVLSRMQRRSVEYGRRKPSPTLRTPTSSQI